MTPKDRVEIVIALLENPNFPGYTIMMPIAAIREGLLSWMKSAMAEEWERKCLPAIGIAARYGMIDGAHHKQWVIDQMVRALLAEKYVDWVAAQNPDYEPWDTGIAP